MTSQNRNNYAKKHSAGEVPAAGIKAEIENRSKNRELPCAVAFKIADDLGVPPDAVGKTGDLINYRIVKCQLGLFGYPQKKIVTAREAPNPEIKDAISSALVDGRLPCKAAWQIADRFSVSKMAVSGICEQMNLKVRPCQLGAF